MNTPRTAGAIVLGALLALALLRRGFHGGVNVSVGGH